MANLFSGLCSGPKELLSLQLFVDENITSSRLCEDFIKAFESMGKMAKRVIPSEERDN